MFNYFKNKLHFPLLLAFLVISVIIITLIVSNSILDYFLNSVKYFLNFKSLYIIIIALSLLLGTFYSFCFVNRGKSKNLHLLKIFGPILDPPVNSLGYGLALSSTLSLFRNMYNQIFFQEKYFLNLDFIDIATIMLACIPLLIWSVNGLVRFFVEVFIKNTAESGMVEPISAEDQNNSSESEGN